MGTTVVVGISVLFSSGDLVLLLCKVEKVLVME